MDPVAKKTARYYISALLITWLLWIVSMIISIKNDISIPYNEGFYNVVTKGFESSRQMILYIVFGLAVYGPLLAALVEKFLFNPKVKAKSNPAKEKRRGLPGKWYAIIIAYPVVVFLFSTLLSAATAGFAGGISMPSLPLWFLPILFIYQFITSGTEEFGWRGLLQPLLQQKYSAEKTCYIIGLLWSVWHYPFIIYTNYKGGVFLTLLSVAGFTLLTVPQAFIMGWLYNSTRSVLSCMLFHAWANTVSFYVLTITPGSQSATIFVAVITWLVANYLTKKFGKSELTINSETQKI